MVGRELSNNLLVYTDLKLWATVATVAVQHSYPTFSILKLSLVLRSFEPILRLLPQSISPVSQHWATWALYNLVSVYREYLLLLRVSNQT